MFLLLLLLFSFERVMTFTSAKIKIKIMVLIVFVFIFQKYFLKNLKYFYFFLCFKLIFLVFSDHFEVLNSKMIFKK
jgi:hypothetical protein